MKLLVASVHEVLLLDGDKQRIIHSGAGTYYGITWSPSRLFLLATNSFGDSVTSVEVLDHDFRRLDSVKIPSVLNVHQAHWSDGLLHIANTGLNRVDVFNEAFGLVRSYNWTGTSEDRNHINSVWTGEGGIWACEHNGAELTKNEPTHRQSRIKKLDADGKVLQDIRIGNSIHNVFVHDGFLHTCSSFNTTILRMNLATGAIETSEEAEGMHTRGLAFDGTTYAVGCSPCLPREKRLTEGDGALVFYDTKLKLTGVLKLPGKKQVYEVRALGEADYAHNGIPF